MSGLDWTLQIHDKISAPARQAASSLRVSEDALLANDSAAKQAQSGAERLAEAKKKLAAASRAMAAAAKAEADAIVAAQKAAMAAHDKAVAKIRADDARTKGIAAKLDSDVKIGSLDAWLAGKNQGRGQFADGRSLGPGATKPSALQAGFRQALQGLEKAMPGSIAGISRFTDAWERLTPVLSAVAGPAKVAASALLALGAIGVGAAAGATKMLYDATQWKQATVFGLTALLKGKEAANAAFNMAARTASDLGLDLNESMASFMSLSSQFGTKGADKLLRMFADLKRMAPTAQIENMSLAIRQIQSTGKLQGDELRQLTDQGALSSSEIYDQIAIKMKVVGKTAEEQRGKVAKLISAGKVDAKTAIDAIQAAAEKKAGGPAGTLAAKGVEESLSGQIQRAATLKDLLLSNAKIDWGPLTAAMKRVNAALDSPAAQRFVDAVGTQLSRAFHVLDGLSTADITSAFDSGTKAVTMLGNGIATAWKWGGYLVDAVQFLGPNFQMMYYAAKPSLDAIGFAFGTVKAEVDAVRAAAKWIGDAVSSAIGPVDSLAGAFEAAAAAAGRVAGNAASIGGVRVSGAGVAAGGALLGGPGAIFGGLLAGARAGGGLVAGGSTYLVGENGPELFTPRGSGSVMANDDLSALVARAGENFGRSRGAGGTSNSHNRTLYIGTLSVGAGASAGGIEDELRSFVEAWA